MAGTSDPSVQRAIGRLRMREKSEREKKEDEMYRRMVWKQLEGLAEAVKRRSIINRGGRRPCRETR